MARAAQGFGGELMGIPRDEFPTITVRAIAELADVLERVDRRVALLLDVDALGHRCTPNLDVLRSYLAELAAQAHWDASAHLRLEAEQAATRKAEAAKWQERWQNDEALVRAGRRPR
jgi:D-serine deaminase-like pyridoxal phosphate-dependent protein